MELIDPFSKGIESPKVRIVTALVPTGKHVGHGNDLHVTRHSGHGGPATALQVYRHKSRGHRQGPFAKKAGLYASRGLQMVAHQPAPTRVPQTGRTAGRVRRLGIMRTGAERRIGFGTTGDARNADMAALRSKVTKGLVFQNGMSTGRRIV